MNTIIKPASILQCPVCQSPLILDNKVWYCDASQNPNDKAHTFDVAKQGYVNLLQVQNKKSQNPGDSKESINARHDFLTAGFYEPLKKELKKELEKILTECIDKEITCLDIGCGEGYYTNAFYNLDAKVETIAVDISKPAVISLAQACKQKNRLWYQTNDNSNSCTPIIASAAHLPISTHSIDIVTSIFSPILVDELFRILKSTGYLIIAKPDKGHLSSVRTALFDEVREHNSDKFLDELEKKGFKLLKKKHISTEIVLKKLHLTNLLTMTPYSYRAKKEKREQLLEKTLKEDFQTQAKFTLYLLSKI